MGKPDVPYRLVVFDELDDPPAVRDLFSRVTGAHPTDAMQWVARVPGVWPKPLNADQARQLLDGLFEMEVAAEAWRTDSFPDLSRPRIVHDVACLEHGFRVKGLRGEPTHWVPWDRVELVSAGRIEAEDEFREVSPPSWISAISTGFRAALGRSPSSQRRSRALRIPRDPVGEVIIVRRDPRIAFRIIENQLNYAYLEDRLRLSAAENFPQLLEDLRRYARNAYITPATKALLAGGDPADFEFANPQALLDYSTHRLLWSWYRRDSEAQDSTDAPNSTDF